MGPLGQPLLNLLLDRRGEHFLSTGSQNLRHHVPALGGWHSQSINATLTHGGVLLGEFVVVNYFLPKYAAFFNYPVHNFRLYPLPLAESALWPRMVG